MSKKRREKHTITHRKMLLSAATVLFVLAAAGALWALCPHPYNRPTPTMDYVSQEIGMFDGIYSEYTEQDCRGCHEDSEDAVKNRHHETPRGDICVDCHAEDQSGDKIIISNCLGGESWQCHATYDNGWHHATDWAFNENCVKCHNPNLIDEITEFYDFATLPPSLVAPTPFSCENCHWEQAIMDQPGDACNPGHPSTYEHVDSFGNLVGYHEYSRSIYDSRLNHHMGGEGFALGQCYQCHSLEPTDPSWDPYNPELIRYCERCHSIERLHGIEAHVSTQAGWAPVGFHWDPVGSVPDPGNIDCTDLAPTYYRTGDDGTGNVERLDPYGDPFDPSRYWGQVPCSPPRTEGFYTADEHCLACHAAGLPPWVPDPPPAVPWLDTGLDGIHPSHGSPVMLVALRGGNFGDEHILGRDVQVGIDPGTGWVWIDAPIYSWSDTLIEWRLTAGLLDPGNYKVRVVTEVGKSNRRNFVVKDHPKLLSANPQNGPCDTWITLSGEFGNQQQKMFADGYHGVHHVVEFEGPITTYTALSYANWSDTSIDVMIGKGFLDEVDTCGEPVDGRNFVRDDGTAVPSGSCTGHICPEEPKVISCNGMALGTYEICVKAIYYGDDDGSGTLTCGDIVFHVDKSDPLDFELTNTPYINKVKPKESERWFEEDCTSAYPGCYVMHKNKIKIIGGNFGPTQGPGDEVRFGSLVHYTKYCGGNTEKGELLPVSLWSNTKIKVKLKVAAEWEGKSKYIWVSKGGQCSNPVPMGILEPTSLCDQSCP
ncbi:MAG: hypothetical protein SWH78_02585 [Thermodesulfobacteriota bacterium]|nr:hypothetical protein [Thermodesulfobacteriota bacterium]